MTRGIYKRTPEMKTGKHMIGKKLSPEHKQKLSISMKGKKRTQAQKQAVGDAHRGKKLSLEHRKKLSIAQSKPKPYRKGKKSPYAKEKHHNWKGGITPINKAIRASTEYRLWREAIFTRDNWTCIWCKLKGDKLNADHIKPFCDYPELRFSIDNGRTLCESCHKKTDTYGWKARWKKKLDFDEEAEKNTINVSVPNDNNTYTINGKDPRDLISRTAVLEMIETMTKNSMSIGYQDAPKEAIEFVKEENLRADSYNQALSDLTTNIKSL